MLPNMAASICTGKKQESKNLKYFIKYRWNLIKQERKRTNKSVVALKQYNFA